MLRLFRAFTATWPARIFFLVLAAAFALWGVATRNPFGPDPSTIASVNGRPIAAADVQQAYAAQVADLRRRLGPSREVTAELRHGAAQIALDAVVTRAAVEQAWRGMGVAAPDDAVRDAIFSVRQFRGGQGTYDHGKMLAVLRDSGTTEAKYVDSVRRVVAQNQLIGAISAGSAPPARLVDRIYASEHETRLADAVDVRLAAQAPPTLPTDAQLRRWVDNHPELYSTPEYRHLKAVILSPDEIAKTVDVAEAEIATAYEQRSAQMTQPERRTVQVLTVATEPSARDLAAQWKTGASWAQMQAAATAADATAVEIPDVARSELPLPELTDAAFALPENAVSEPVKGGLGWYVARVAAIRPAGVRPLAELRDQIRAALAHEKAGDLIYDRANKIEDLLAGGSSFEQLWGELGLIPVAGTLDAAGRTAAGADAPVPGGAELRAALIAAAFAAHPNEPARLVPVPVPGAPPGTPPLGEFAVTVDEITPPKAKPYDEVAAAARADWLRDATRRAADAQAAGILAAVQGGKTLAAAAAAAHLPVRHLPPVESPRRAQAPADVPPVLPGILFGLRPDAVTMIETPDGFTVAQLRQIVSPEAAGDAAGAARVRASLEQAMARDTEIAFANAIRDASHPTVNAATLDGLTRTAGDP